MNDRVNIKQAAKELGMTQYCLKTLMRNHEIDIGFYVKQEDRPHGRYMVCRHLLDKELERLGLKEVVT